MSWSSGAATRRKELRAERRAAGLCAWCGKDAKGKYACSRCRKTRSNYEQTNKVKFREIRKAFCAKQKKLAIDHYGGTCKCCGESCIDFLSIDHVNCDGGKHRKEIKKNGSNFYHWLVKNGFPDSYSLQVLCFNCPTWDVE